MLTDNRCVALGRHYGCSCHDNGDALARRVAELEAALSGTTAELYGFGANLKESRAKAAYDRGMRALASSGGTGEAREGGDAHASRRELHGSSNHGAQAVTGAAHPNNAGLREIAERAREAIGEMHCKCPVSPLICKHAQVLKDMDRVLSGERATRDEGAGNEAASGKHTSPGTHETGEVKGRSGDGADWSPAKPQAANPALPSREQAGRADSSASERERALAWLVSWTPDIAGRGENHPAPRFVDSLATEFAAIRREAIEEAAKVAEDRRAKWWRHDIKGVSKDIAKAIRALAGDAPATREEA